MPRRRTIYALLISLVFGCLAAWGIAWACSLWSSPYRSWSNVRDKVPEDVADRIPAEWLVRKRPNVPGGIAIIDDGRTGLGLEITELSIWEAIPGTNPGSFHQFYRHRAGWPFAACEWSITAPIGGPPVVANAAQAPSWLAPAPDIANSFPAGWPSAAILPMKPLWGLAANSIVFGGIFLIGLAMPRILRSYRLARGRCVACSYSLAGLPSDAACPECGCGR